MTRDREDHQPARRWMEELRPRLLAIAGRRVPADDAEDVVQEALRIITERGLNAEAEEPDGELPPVAWCLQVLRNVIGNHYRRARTQRKYIDTTVRPEETGRWLEVLDPTARAAAIEEGLYRLAEVDPGCGRYLGRLLEGAAVHEIAAENRLPINALYQRLYRCRRKLRRILREQGLMP